MAQVERPREGYGYSVASGTAIATRSYVSAHPFIVVFEVRTIQRTRRCVQNKCLLQLTGVPHFRTDNRNLYSLLDVGGRDATLLLSSREVNKPGTPGGRVQPRPSVCVMAIDVHSLFFIEMRALSPRHSSL